MGVSSLVFVMLNLSTNDRRDHCEVKNDLLDAIHKKVKKSRWDIMVYWSS